MLGERLHVRKEVLHTCEARVDAFTRFLARRTADELKRVPHRPSQVPRQKQQHKTPTEPLDAA